MSDKLTDIRTPFFMVEDAVFSYNLTPYEGWVYMAILKHADRQTGVAFPGMARLAKMCSMSQDKVAKCIKALEEKGVIAVERDPIPEKGESRARKSNRYTVLSLSNQPEGYTSTAGRGTRPQRVGVAASDVHNQIQEPDSINNLSSDADTGKAEPVPAAQMNPMKDAIAAAFGYGWKTMTKTEKGLVQKTARELCLADVKPEQVGALYRYCAARFTTFKPGALSGNVSDWRKATQPQPSTSKGDKNSPDYDPRYDLDIPVEFDPWDNFPKFEYAEPDDPAPKSTSESESQL